MDDDESPPALPLVLLGDTLTLALLVGMALLQLLLLADASAAGVLTLALLVGTAALGVGVLPASRSFRSFANFQAGTFSSLMVGKLFYYEEAMQSEDKVGGSRLCGYE
jgi:hypothetical protein